MTRFSGFQQKQIDNVKDAFRSGVDDPSQYITSTETEWCQLTAAAVACASGSPTRLDCRVSRLPALCRSHSLLCRFANPVSNNNTYDLLAWVYTLEAFMYPC